MAEIEYVVFCLCAAWCGTCRDYAPVFEGVDAGLAGQVRFVWVDIEERESLLDEVGLEIETFPTLLVCRAGLPLFFGAVTPHADSVMRLLRAALDGNFRPLTDPVVIELARRLG